MIVVKKEGLLLSKTDFGFENGGVLNPGAIRENDNVHLLYRAVRKGNFSTIGYCKLEGPLNIVERWEKPFIVGEHQYESHGVEDPRIVKIDGLFYITYTAFDGVNACGALATSENLWQISKHGIIVPPVSYAEFVFLSEKAAAVNEKYYRNYKFYYQEVDPDKKMMLWDKDVILFPRKIKNKFAFLHRIRPGIQIVYVDDFKDLTKEFWNEYFRNFHDKIVMDPVFKHEQGYIGGGCPPIETEYGWLLIYHSIEVTSNGSICNACAALLDSENPEKEISRLPYPLFVPEFEWEHNGEVNDVVFPTGTALFGENLYIYYGAADSCIAVASVNLQDLLTELLTYSLKSKL